MANLIFIEVDATLTVGDTDYNVTLSPLTKKEAKEIKKPLKEAIKGLKGRVDNESKLARVNEEIEILEELKDLHDENRGKYLLELRDYQKQREALKKQLADTQEETTEATEEAKEKMNEEIIKKMVSGKDKQAFLKVIAPYSPTIFVSQLRKAYEDEIEGKLEESQDS